MATVLTKDAATTTARPVVVQRTNRDSDRDSKGELDASNVSVNSSNPPLGVAIEEKRFWWQRAKAYDPDAVATLVRQLRSLPLPLH